MLGPFFERTEGGAAPALLTATSGASLYGRLALDTMCDGSLERKEVFTSRLVNRVPVVE